MSFSRWRQLHIIDGVIATTRAPAVSIGNVYNVGGGSMTGLGEAVDRPSEISGTRIEVDHEPDQVGDAGDTGTDTSGRGRSRVPAGGRSEAGLRPAVRVVCGRGAAG
jgi:hypothetical protein